MNREEPLQPPSLPHPLPSTSVNQVQHSAPPLPPPFPPTQTPPTCPKAHHLCIEQLHRQSVQCSTQRLPLRLPHVPNQLQQPAVAVQKVHCHIHFEAAVIQQQQQHCHRLCQQQAQLVNRTRAQLRQQQQQAARQAALLALGLGNTRDT